jgi:hypothetical protein
MIMKIITMPVLCLAVVFSFGFGSEAELLAGGRVLVVEDARAPEQDIPLIHNDAFHVMNRDSVRHYRVSS